VDRPVNEWIGISGRFIHRFLCVYTIIYEYLQLNPPDFHFRNRFRFHMYVMYARACVSASVLLYIHCCEKDKKRKSTVNRTHNPMNLYIYTISTFYILGFQTVFCVQVTHVGYAHPSPDNIEILYMSVV
jgi:hypothetical protein